MGRSCDTSARVDAVCHAMPGAAAEATTVPELGAEISRQVGRVVPHDGYTLVAVDPVTRAYVFSVGEHSYSTRSQRRLAIEDAHRRDRHSFTQLVSGRRQVGVFGSGSPKERDSEHQHDILAAEGFGSEMRIALMHGGVLWGGMVLLRERSRTPFLPAEVQQAERLARHITFALQRFVSGKPLRPIRCGVAPGVALVGRDFEVKGVTPTGRDALRALVPPPGPADDEELFALLWNVTHMARSASGPALSRIPTPQGWIALHAQLLEGTAAGDVAVTIQPAAADTLLPAVTAWYGITSREQAVIEQALQGLPVKQIARRLGLSPHTVNDHFKAIYRKTGVSGREELIVCLSG